MINLMEKYSAKLPKIWGHNSFIEGAVNEGYSWDGVKGIIITDIISQPLNDYQRSGTSRYGAPKDVQDWRQSLQLRHDKSYAMVIDRGDNSEQQMLKSSGKVTKKQTKEQVNPLRDKNAFSEWAKHAGHVIELSEAMSKANIVENLLEAEVYMNNKAVPMDDRRLYIKNTYHKMLRLSTEFNNCDNLKDRLVFKNKLGDLSTFTVIGVPDSWLPANVEYLAVYKESVFAPRKIQELHLHKDPPGISGHLLEARYIFDAFVFGALANGCVIGVTKGSKTVKPAASGDTTDGVTLTSTTADAIIRYTVDGSDPRYSDSAKIYTSAIKKGEGGADLKVGDVILAYAEKLTDNLYNSDVISHTAAEATGA